MTKKTETCDEGMPHLITDVTMSAAVPDVLAIAPNEEDLVARDLVLAQHLDDSG